MPAAIGEVYNVGNIEEVTIRELAERIKAATGSQSPIVTIPYDEAYEAGFEDMPRRVPDLTKIHKAIGYVPKVGLDEIISRVVAEKRGYAGSNRTHAVGRRWRGHVHVHEHGRRNSSFHERGVYNARSVRERRPRRPRLDASVL